MQKCFNDKLILDNHANDFYIEWVELEKESMAQLFKEVFGANLSGGVNVHVDVTDIMIIFKKRKEKEER